MGTEYFKTEYKEEYIKSVENIELLFKNKELPSTGLSFAPVVVPLVLIFINSAVNFAGIEGVLHLCKLFWSSNRCINHRYNFIGLWIREKYVETRSIRLYGRRNQSDRNDYVNHWSRWSLGNVVKVSGIGDALGEAILGTPIPVILIPFIIAALMKIALGSATFALTTAATLTAPLVMQLEMSPILAAMSTCAGGVAFSYFNDSGYWVFNGLYGLKDNKDQFWAKTMISFIGSGVSLIVVFIASFFL